jgi:hypothetical protein
MEIVTEYSQVGAQWETYPGVFEDGYDTYQMLKCPACSKITVQMYGFNGLMDVNDVTFIILYPATHKDDIPSGLPEAINKALIAAQKVKSIDVNAFAVLLGRVLEMVCQDRKASGKNLSEQLKDLAEKNEIPNKLVVVANKLRLLRNIGAHAGLGELTAGEIPILNALCNAVLEYVYTAPYLADQAEQRVNELKLKGKEPN